MKNKKQLIESLSVLEHEQWMTWAKNILETENISSETRTRWEQYFVPYHDLPEDIKNLDRPFAQKSLELFEQYLKENN